MIPSGNFFIFKHFFSTLETSTLYKDVFSNVNTCFTHGSYRVVAWYRCAAVVPLHLEMMYCAGTAESSSATCSTAAALSCWGMTAQLSPGDGEAAAGG